MMGKVSYIKKKIIKAREKLIGRKACAKVVRRERD